jgi:uncharacterized membrane protein
MARSAFWLVPALCVVAAVGTMEQDLAFGFRQLTDIAERALSPAVNDPTTAVQAIDVLHDLLRALATRSGPPGCWRDEDGRPGWSCRSTGSLTSSSSRWGRSGTTAPGPRRSPPG